MVTSHIKGNSLILVTLPMSDGIEKQKAARLARQADPQGHRTIGVMTKPDPKRGRCGLTCSKAAITPCYMMSASMAFREQQHVARLPTLLDKVALQLETCTAQLEKLPRPVSTEPSAFVLALVTNFSSELNAWIRGGIAADGSEDAAMGCFEAVQLVFKDVIGELVRAYFGRYNILKGMIGPVIMELGSICAEQTIERIRFILSLETSPFTQNGHYLSDGREKWLGIYKDIGAGKSDAEAAIAASALPTAQRSLPTPATIETSDIEGKPGAGNEQGITDPRQDDNEKEVLLNEALAVLAKLGYTGLTEEGLGKLNKTDEYDEGLRLIAEVRTYFQAAYKRVIDYVPLAIDHSFLYAFSEKLRERPLERLGLGGAYASERCIGYIAEDPGVVAQRDELTSKKKRLGNVQRVFVQLWPVSTTGPYPLFALA
ncbi:hypothetical protein GY45DRAFT_1376242 [Cubamyces sp. BRFM 1775]|nr:hypothetical protein GY45DRAFT_1376242 [Cubamyces sp. BRFM 1775]